MAKRKGKGKRHKPNDNRSMALNPNSPHFKATQDNRANQLNPRHPAYGGSRGGSKGGAKAGGGVPGAEEFRSRLAESLGGGSCFDCAIERKRKELLLPPPLATPIVLSHSGHAISTLMAPSFTIAYGTLSDPWPRDTALGPETAREIVMAFCRPTPRDENAVAALERARAHYPQVTWRVIDLHDSSPPMVEYWEDLNPPPKFDPLDLGTVPWDGREPPYCAMLFTTEDDLDGDDIHVYLTKGPYVNFNPVIELTRDGNLHFHDNVGLEKLEDLADPARHHRHGFL